MSSKRTFDLTNPKDIDKMMGILDEMSDVQFESGSDEEDEIDMMKNTLSKDSSGSDDENSVDARDEEMDGAGGEKNEVVAGPPLPTI